MYICRSIFYKSNLFDTCKKKRRVSIATAAVVALLFSGSLEAAPFGLIGGEYTAGPSYAAFVSPTGSLTLLAPIPASGFILSVSINDSGSGLIGGRDTGAAYAALISSTGTLTSLAPPSASGIINSVAINSLGNGLIGGQNLSSGAPYAALISSTGTLTSLTFPPPLPPVVGIINSVAINNSGSGLVGGSNSLSGALYAALVSSTGTVTPLTGLPASGTTRSVAINNSGSGLIGGNSAGSAYAALVSSTGTATSLTGPPVSGIITSVAINSLGSGLIGGQNLPAPVTYVALVSSTGTVTPLTGVPMSGVINSVAINDSGVGLIGGRNFLAAYAALISSNGTVTPLTGLPTDGIINSVAINNAGSGLIGGRDFTSAGAYAALISSNGTVIPLTGLPTFSIYSVSLALLPLLSNIPTEGLSGNSLILANYINEHSPDTAFYFVPSSLDGTLPQALESAAPTRNALAFFTAASNLFYLNHSLSNHLQNTHHFRDREPAGSTLSAELNSLRPDELTAAIGEVRPRAGSQKHAKPSSDERPYTIWMDGIGAFAKQKPQNQTVGFEPNTGAAIVGIDAVLNSKVWVGGGAAYSYTHIHERHDAGHSNINQESLFVYSSYAPSKFYLDAAFWAGFFQISQVRHIRMTGFEFNAKSHPHGWQLAPHLEIGYNAIDTNTFILDPFIMLDWVASWQNSFKERGGSPFNFQQKRHFGSLLRGEAGLRFFETISFDRWNLVFQEKGSYVRREPFSTGTLTAALVGAPGSFTVETLSSAQNLAVLEVGAIFEPKNHSYPFGTLNYQAEFNGRYQSHQVVVEIAWNF